MSPFTPKHLGVLETYRVSVQLLRVCRTSSLQPDLRTRDVPVHGAEPPQTCESMCVCVCVVTHWALVSFYNCVCVCVSCLVSPLTNKPPLSKFFTRDLWPIMWPLIKPRILPGVLVSSKYLSRPWLGFFLFLFGPHVQALFRRKWHHSFFPCQHFWK